MRRWFGLLAASALVASPAATADQSAEAIGFICRAEASPSAERTGPLPKIDKVGVGGFPIRTASAEAQAWFDYGSALYHAFYHNDAKLAFQRAVELDPSCAMCLWGQAWASGAVLNYGVSEKDTEAALALAQKAAELAKDGPEKERALTAALIQRYTPGKDRELGFAKALETLAAGDDPIGVIAAHQWMIAEDAGKAIALLEGVLARHPEDTGAIHYYIHATEWAGVAHKAEAYADKLGSLAPNASHLVHMPGHTFMRIGRYRDAAFVNAAAVEADARYGAAMEQKGSGARLMYYSHNVDFGLGGALLSGDGPLAVKFAEHIQSRFKDPAARNGGLPWLMGETYVAMALHDPARAMSLPDPGADQPALRMMRHYARGEAFAAQGDARAVRAEARQIRGRDEKSRIAKLVLEGRAAMIEGKPAAAARSFERAARMQQDAFGGGMDPPPWWYPVRRSLAAAHLKSGRPQQAAAEARKVLESWPNEPLTLWVLAEAEEALGESEAASTHRTKAAEGWAGDLTNVSLSTI